MTHFTNASSPISAPPSRVENEGAQSLVEFALVLPFMLLLCLGIAEIGRAAFISMTVNDAAFAAVEYGAQNSNTAADLSGMSATALSDGNLSGMTASANHYCECDPVSGDGAGTSCNPAGATACSSVSCGSGQVVECVSVTTHSSFNALFSYPALPSSFQANGRAVMRVRK